MINSWIYDHTDHMIKKVLSQLDPETVMVLVNAISFDAKWEDKYEESQITEGKFTKADGETQKVTYLNDTTKRYFETEIQELHEIKKSLAARDQLALEEAHDAAWGMALSGNIGDYEPFR